MDPLENKIAAMYHAIGRSMDTDLAQATRIHTSDRGVLVILDATAGRSQLDLLHDALPLIYAIANMYDALKGWAKANNVSEDRIKAAARNSQGWSVVRDLANAERHAYPERPPNSGFRPKLVGLHRPVRISTDPVAGSFSGITLGPRGFRHVGDGSAAAVITGDIVDDAGNRRGDLRETEEAAVADIEALLNGLGIRLRSA
jgi:hypothetical protein